MRMSEILGLTWGGVDLSTRKLHVSVQLSRASKGHAAERVLVKTDLPRDIDLDEAFLPSSEGVERRPSPAGEPSRRTT